MPELRLSEIPEYLRSGALYKIMLENDDGQEKKTQVENLHDFEYLLNSLNFWGVDTFF